MVLRRLLLVSSLLIALPLTAAAQGPDPKDEPWTRAKLNLGGFFIAPSFMFRDVGIDDNVFRDSFKPRKDLTATVAVSSIFGFHTRALLVTLTQDNSYLWFRRYRSERSIDGGLRGAMELRFASFRPWIRWKKQTSHDRSGIEIDARAGRTTPAIDGGMDFKFGFRTGASFAVRRDSLTYSEGETEVGQFGVFDLATELDRKSLNLTASGKWRYSDYTELIGGVEFTRDQFRREITRDNDSYFYFGGFHGGGEGAPLVGELRVGYKEQRHTDRTIKDFKGLAMSGDITTTLLDHIRLTLKANRDVGYSYDNVFPFYLQEGAGVNALFRISTRLDLLASYRQDFLRYRYVIGGPDRSRDEMGIVSTVGFIYNMGGGEGSHFGLTYEQAKRDAPGVERRNFKSSRVLSNLRFSF
jgi:hypothetical protein